MIWLKTRIAAILAAVGGVLAALGVMYAKGRKDATRARENDDLKDAYNRERTRDEIDRTSSGSDARDRLRSDWRRD